jgi:MFS family permease
MRKASLGTIFFTVFLDLLGFGLVVPYLPGVARMHGASDLVATLLGASYSLMQLLFVPVWGHLSDRVGRRPVLAWSIAASILGMLVLARATSLWMLFAARLWGGAATANITVAQAYIADVTKPGERARGMGLIGAGIGVGFVLGPVFGGQLEAHSLFARPGAMAAYAAAALSGLNLLFALRFLPESLAPAERGKHVRSLSPFSADRFRLALGTRGVPRALAVNFVVVLSFSGLEQTFRLFTEDELGMSVRATGALLGFMGLVLLVVQGGLLRPLARAAGERTLVVAGLAVQVGGFALFAGSPGLGAHALGAIYAATGIIAFGSGLTNPSLSAFVSRSAGVHEQGTVLGVLQSAGALARVLGPATGGLLYQSVGHAAPYATAAVGMSIASGVALGLRRAG